MAIPRPSPWLSLILAAVSLLAVLWAESAHSASAESQATLALTSRVTSLEAHQVDSSDRLAHIQTQVDKLVEWALGHK